MALHIDKGLVELLRYDDEHQVSEKGKFATPSPPKTKRCHQCKSQFYQKGVSTHTHSCQTRSILTAFSKFTNRVVESVTKHSFSSEDFQHRYALDVFNEETDHIRQTVLRLLLCFHSRTDAPIQGEEGNRKDGNHRQPHVPVHPEQPDAEYQRHDEISGHPCPKVPHHHFHIVHVFVNDSTYLAQPFIGVEAKREHFQFQDDLLTDALHEIEAGKVLAHIGYGIGYGFQNQQTNEYPRCRNERNAFARYMAVDKEQDSKHYCRSAKGINHEKQCGDYQMPHSANGQFIQYIAYHCLYLLLFQLPFAYPFLCFRHIAI